MIRLDRNQCSQLDFVKSREWLVTNRLGGYASGTVVGMNTRRYHGLLVASSPDGPGRFVLLSQLEDTLIIDGARFALSTNQYVGNVVYPEGYLHLAEFRLDPDPVFTYTNGEWEITRAITMIPGENTTVVEYRLGAMKTKAKISLEIRPLIAFRDYHATTHENEALNRYVERQKGVLSIQPYSSLPKLHLAHDPANAQIEGYWYRAFEYEQELERGLDSREDLFSPLMLTANLDDEGSFRLIASTERRFTSGLAKSKPAKIGKRKHVSGASSEAISREDLVVLLERAADQFIISRPPYTSTIAGYHWFGDWGRDTMIALPGLLLSTGKPQLARQILLHYLRYIDRGMLPNRFPDAGDQPEYNTVDATLWFFEAVRQYVFYENSDVWRSQAHALLHDQFYEPLKEIVRNHMEGTRYGIHVDEQGFLWAGAPNTQLTWMDAKDGNVVFTPRNGRPVEIQALWYNSLRTLASFGHLLNDQHSAEQYNALADRLRDNFLNVFWNKERGCLFDVAREEERDGALRPNQIFAISLRYPLIFGETASRVIQAVEDALLTPFGLRTLSQDDSQYKAHYLGNSWSRDSAYHQGTIWPWLAGPFFFAKLSVKKSSAKTMTEIGQWLDRFAGHLRDAGLSQVSEIFDGDFPFTPRGCIAQAWSVAEILRLAKYIDLKQADQDAHETGSPF